MVEARNSSGEEFGMDRFKEMVEEHHALPAERFADAVLNGVARWSKTISGPRQSDDITLLAIDFKGVG